MSLYEKYILPSLINCACGMKSHRLQREKIVPMAEGNVLEIGIGPGLNLPIYDSAKITRLTAIDPFEDTWKKGAIDESKLPFDFKFIVAFAEHLPFDENSFDTIVMTYSLCTIPEPYKALLY